MKYIVLKLIFLLAFANLLAKTAVMTYFEQTDHEIQVYHIQGQEPGATIMIIGGIQGDETAAYFVADFFIDLKLKKGNLIIVPRANLPTIFANRRLINQDMNRRFAQSNSVIYEDEVVEILKKYMHKSDVMLNLHEGGGFYRHTWEGPNHNPMKYGQCLIADADSLYIEETGKTIHLKKIAEAVIEEINEHIEIDEYLYRFNNHDTLSRSTSHAEQRGSASFYGLTKAQIPSFGVEVSKQLPSETLKKEYIKLIINKFMKYYDIQKDCPPLYEPNPVLEYLLVLINEKKMYVEPGDTIFLDENSSLKVVKIKTNYPRGNFVDLAGFGNKNDLNKSFVISRNTELIVNKDNQQIAKIPVRIHDQRILAFDGFRVNILDDNTYRNVFSGDTLTVVEGVDIEIVGPLNYNPDIQISISGANIRNLQGKRILDTFNGLSERFAINKEKNVYEILISEKNILLTKSYLRIEPLTAYGLHITHNDKLVVMAPGDTLITEYNDKVFIHDVELKQLSSDKVKVNFAGYVLDPKKDAEDRGGDIHLNNRGLISKFAVNREKNIYEIHILFNRNRYATYSIKINNIPS